MRGLRLLAVKLGQMVLTLLVLTLLVFALARLAPGDPLYAYYGDSVDRMSASQLDNAVRRLGLDEPLTSQYLIWLDNCLHGDFGILYKYKQPVAQVVSGLWQNTLILGGSAFVLTFLLAFFLGIYCAQHEDKPLDRLICRLGNIFNAIPSFWLALLFILIFAVILGLLPSGGAYALGRSASLSSRLQHLILPLSVLTLSHFWYYGFLVRNKLLQELNQNYVMLCKARGMSKRAIVYRHCLRSIMPSMLYVMALGLPHLLGGTYVIEQVFAYPGLGRLCFESALYHDYNTLMLLSLLTGALVVVGNMLAQLLAERLDPRTKQGGGESDDC